MMDTPDKEFLPDEIDTSGIHITEKQIDKVRWILLKEDPIPELAHYLGISEYIAQQLVDFIFTLDTPGQSSIQSEVPPGESGRGASDEGPAAAPAGPSSCSRGNDAE